MTRNPGQVAAPGPGNTGAHAAQGQVSPTPNQQGGILSTIIPAGATVPQQLQGSFFYVIAASGAVNVRPKGGSFNGYQPGTGYKMPLDDKGLTTSFSMLEIQNPGTADVAVAMFIGFGGFIDNRLILEGGVVQPICNPTNPDPGTVGPILIPDISGESFSDQNGEEWLAVNRIAIIVSNFNAAGGTTYNLQDFAGTGKVVAAIFPQTSLYFAASGGFSIKAGASLINCSVVEIYNALSPTIPL
jgi:hypothetical protein